MPPAGTAKICRRDTERQQPGGTGHFPLNLAGFMFIRMDSINSFMNEHLQIHPRSALRKLNDASFSWGSDYGLQCSQ